VLSQGLVGSKKGTKSKYQSGVENKFKGGGKAKMKLYPNQLIGKFGRVEEIATKNNLGKIELTKYKIGYSPLQIKEYAFPTPHREASS